MIAGDHGPRGVQPRWPLGHLGRKSGFFKISRSILATTYSCRHIAVEHGAPSSPDYCEEEEREWPQVSR